MIDADMYGMIPKAKIDALEKVRTKGKALGRLIELAREKADGKDNGKPANEKR